jgi:hypothetical protein
MDDALTTVGLAGRFVLVGAEPGVRTDEFGLGERIAVC